jgi:hypothetical protein
MTDIAPQHAGRSILEIIWEELDSVYDQLVNSDAPDIWDEDNGSGDPVGVPEEWQKWGELRGQAQGLAYAIAVIQNPYDVSVPAVRAEAKRRYDDTNED